MAELEQHDAVDGDDDLIAAEGIDGGTDPGRLGVLGERDVGDPRPGEGPFQWRDEDGVAQPAQFGEIAADGQVEHRVGGEPRRWRPEGQLQWMPAPSGGGAEQRQHQVKGRFLYVDRRDEGHVGRDAGERPITESAAQPVDLARAWLVDEQRNAEPATG
jgi:hypothetical protein